MGEIPTLYNLATIEIRVGNSDIAYKNFQRALELMQEACDRRGIIEPLQKLAKIDIGQEKLRSALNILLKALDFWQEVGDEVEDVSIQEQLDAMIQELQ